MFAYMCACVLIRESTLPIEEAGCKRVVISSGGHEEKVEYAVMISPPRVSEIRASSVTSYRCRSWI